MQHTEARCAAPSLARFGLEELTCILILCFFGVTGSIPGIAPNQAAEMTGAVPTGFMILVGLGSQLIVDAAIATLILRHLPAIVSRGYAMQWTAALALFAVISIAWSQEPLLSARRSLPFALAALFGLYLATRFPLERQLSMLQATFVLLAIGSAAAALCFPRIGLDASTGHAGDWQGVFTQKNACGRAMVFASAALLARGRLTARRLCTLSCFLLVLVKSGSRGAWAIELLLIAGLLLLHALARVEGRARTWIALVSLSVGLGTIGLGKMFFPLLASLAGRDATLTGRTAIWVEVWHAILRRPWLGYGFSAFWRGSKGASFDVIVALKFVLFHAHNGFLEIWLELGAAGLVLFLLSYMRGCYQLWPIIHSGDVKAAAWPASMLLLIAAYDFDENTLLTFNGLFWVLYVAALAQIELMARARRVCTTARAPGESVHSRDHKAACTPARMPRRFAPTGAAWL